MALSAAMQLNDPVTETLDDALGRYTRALCTNLHLGMGDIFELVTPTTATLLHWWFGHARVAARGQLNFHPLQRQAILNLIVAQEVIAAPGVRELYLHVAPQALPANAYRMARDDARNTHPRYGLALPAEVDATPVFIAILIWQLLNRNAAHAAGWSDARFAHNFLLVAADAAARQRLHRALFGHVRPGARNFTRSAFVQCAELYLPHALRTEVFRFVRASAWVAGEPGPFGADGLMALCDMQFLLADKQAEPHAAPAASSTVIPMRARTRADDTGHSALAPKSPVDTVKHLAALSELCMLTDGAVASALQRRWDERLTAIAARKGQRFVEVDFLNLAADAPSRCEDVPHMILRP